MIFHGDCVAQIMIGDCLESLRTLPDKFVAAGVTSPPYYGLRDYGVEGQIGLEKTPEQYIARLVEVFREFRRVLRDDGTLWVNIGDSYANDKKWGGSSGGKHVAALHGETNIGRGKKYTGLKEKDLIGIPWMLAFALRADGWYLRQDIIWQKPNPMPESVGDRCTKAHEYLFLLSKSARYFYDANAIKEPVVKGAAGSSFNKGKTAVHQLNRASDAERIESDTRNKRSVWTVAPRAYKGAHFATFPPELITPCILAGSRPGNVVLDPFGGSGTTAAVALKHGRHAILCELNAEYAALVPNRITAITKTGPGTL